MDKKYIIGIIIAILAIIAISAFSMGGNSAEKADTELIVAIDEEPEGGFDPLTGWASARSKEPLIQSRVFKFDGNDTLINDLGTGYTVSDDLKTVDVTLRDGVKFTDDTPLTAEDVAFTYNSAKEMGTTDLSTMEEATAVDDTHVKFTLNQPDSTFIHKLAKIGIVPSDSYNNETYGSNPVGSGPYKLVQWDKGQQAIFEVNENYYGEKPYYTKITNLFLEPDAAYAAAQKGELDIVELPLAYANETIDGMNKITIPSIDVRGISFPVIPNNGEINEDGSGIGNNVTCDPAIREAINVGINRQKLIDGSFNGYGDVSYYITQSGTPIAPKENLTDGDVEQAKQVLADAGWTDTDGDGIVEKDGQKATFELDYISGDTTRQSLALQVVEQAKEFGIEIEPVGQTWDELEKSTKNCNAWWEGGGDIDPYFIHGRYSSDVAGIAWNNAAYYNNSAVEELMTKAMAQDLNSSYSTWAEAVSLAQKDNPYVWVGSLDYLFFVSESVDMSPDTHYIYGHGGDEWGNIADWKHVDTNSTE